MTVSIDRIERLEAIFRALTDETCTLMAGALARVVLQPEFCSQLANMGEREAPIALSWGDLELYFGMPRQYLADDLSGADRSSSVTLGFALTQPVYRGVIRGSEVDEEQLVLSDDFSSILSGSVSPRRWPKQDPSALPKPDKHSTEGLGLAHKFAMLGGGALFYRQAATEGSLQQLEITNLANALTATEEEAEVFVTAELDLSWRRLKLLPSLLSGVLYSPERAIVLSPFDGQFAAEVPAHYNNFEDDELSGPVVRKTLTLAHDADKIVALLPHLTQSVLVTIPAEGTLPTTYASAFSGAIGPFRFDRHDAIEKVRDGVIGHSLSECTAQSVFDIFGGLQNAKTLLGTCDRLMRDNRAENVDFDKIVGKLTSSLAPLFASSKGPAGSSSKLQEFDPELTICTPDLTPYLARAEHLRAAGAKFLLTGEPGTGKTAAASMIAQKLGFEIKFLGGADVFGRAWGATERLIHKAFDDAVTKNVILFIDEADALLTNRATQDNGRNLAVTATSEFMKHLASHPLPVIAATNFLEDIDKGIIRRFDFIVQTKPLPKEREILAWKRMLHLDPPASFRPIGETVVADYVLVRRRLKMLGNNDPILALSILREVRAVRRGDEKASYGFCT